MIVLGIETSCDETAAALVTGDGIILADEVLSQETEHAPYGGIVPEVAARAHLQHLDRLIGRALEKAGGGFERVDAVAATGGPGLIGGVIVGVMTAKAIAAARGIPFLAVNHLEGHALSPRLSEGAAKLGFPYLLLLASGGHCQFLAVEGIGRYRRESLRRVDPQLDISARGLDAKILLGLQAKPGGGYSLRLEGHLVIREARGLKQFLKEMMEAFRVAVYRLQAAV